MTTANPDIHRLLDEAFATIETTPESQDLKEEVRANLLARVEELESFGTPPAEAAREAIAELGDLRVMVGEAAADAPRSHAQLVQRNRVRPGPAFVVRIVIAAIVTAGALAYVLLGLFDLAPLPVGTLFAMLALASAALGWIVGDSLAQETTTNHPMPQTRAGGYYLATSLLFVGLGATAIILLKALPLWPLVLSVSGIVGGIVLFAFLGATQTNRHKAWVLQLHREYAEVGNRFEQEPEAAVRFGIYTLVIWVLAFAAFIVLSFTVGWAWSWLALVGGLVLMLLTLARMLFAPQR